jgi:hypothetical protein
MLIFFLAGCIVMHVFRSFSSILLAILVLLVARAVPVYCVVCTCNASIENFESLHANYGNEKMMCFT